MQQTAEMQRSLPGSSLVGSLLCSCAPVRAWSERDSSERGGPRGRPQRGGSSARHSSATRGRRRVGESVSWSRFLMPSLSDELRRRVALRGAGRDGCSGRGLCWSK
eukprot:scaffold29429_cov30-Tisochrysis_lutea.AAC.5